jgi:hypothetical protein
MKIFTITQDKIEQFWELRTLDAVVQGQVTPAGWLVIDRVVHTGPSHCINDTCEARDTPGRAHLGRCTIVQL